jgi:hypothetical protein
MNIFFITTICFAIASCSSRQDNNILPEYSDMSAAEDAGRVK